MQKLKRPADKTMKLEDLNQQALKNKKIRKTEKEERLSRHP